MGDVAQLARVFDWQSKIQIIQETSKPFIHRGSEVFLCVKIIGGGVWWYTFLKLLHSIKDL